MWGPPLCCGSVTAALLLALVSSQAPLISSPFVLDTAAPDDAPAILGVDGGFILLWTRSGQGAFTARLDPGAEGLTPNLLDSAGGSTLATGFDGPMLASAGGVVWGLYGASGTRTFGRVILPDGTGGPMQLALRDSKCVAAREDSFVVAHWVTSNLTFWELALSEFSPSGLVVTSVTPTGSGFNPMTQGASPIACSGAGDRAVAVFTAGRTDQLFPWQLQGATLDDAGITQLPYSAAASGVRLAASPSEVFLFRTFAMGSGLDNISSVFGADAGAANQGTRANVVTLPQPEFSASAWDGRRDFWLAWSDGVAIDLYRTTPVAAESPVEITPGTTVQSLRLAFVDDVGLLASVEAVSDGGTEMRGRWLNRLRKGDVCTDHAQCWTNSCSCGLQCVETTGGSCTATCGEIRCPRSDAGIDAGVDAGTDAGTDAGGVLISDAGSDAGSSDAGTDDAGTLDAGTSDAGSDAGAVVPSDAGVDAGASETPDGGTAPTDGGVQARGLAVGCGCSQTHHEFWPPLLGMLLFLSSRRRSSS